MSALNNYNYNADYNPAKLFLLRAEFDIKLTKSVETDGHVALGNIPQISVSFLKKNRLELLSN